MNKILDALFGRSVDPATEVADESGMKALRYTKRSAPIIIHPNDLYNRVAPDGPYDVAWQGVQKLNAITQVAINRPTIENPLTSTRMYRPNGNILLNGAAPVGDGPAIYAEENQGTAYEEQPGLLASIFARLGR